MGCVDLLKDQTIYPLLSLIPVINTKIHLFNNYHNIKYVFKRCNLN